jgi:hypothetical protein
MMMVAVEFLLHFCSIHSPFHRFPPFHKAYVMLFSPTDKSGVIGSSSAGSNVFQLTIYSSHKGFNFSDPVHEPKLIKVTKTYIICVPSFVGTGQCEGQGFGCVFRFLKFDLHVARRPTAEFLDTTYLLGSAGNANECLCSYRHFRRIRFVPHFSAASLSRLVLQTYLHICIECHLLKRFYRFA